jgi:hypothetical protein
MKHLLSLLFIFAILSTTSAQNRKFKRIKHADLTEQGVKVFSKLATMTPNIKLEDARIYPEEGFAIWTNQKAFIITAEENESPAKMMSSSWQRRTYKWPGGRVLEITCWCNEFETETPGDDCEFDDTHGEEPVYTECVGSCGCNRTDIFKPGPNGGNLLETVTPY